jgi:hypothetical protein
MKKTLVIAASILCAVTVRAQTNAQTAMPAATPSPQTCLSGELTERGSNQLFMCNKTGSWVPMAANAPATPVASASDVEAALERATDGFIGSFRRR